MNTKRIAGSFEVFFDGGCPLCGREIAWLRKRDNAGRIVFTDIAAEDFEPEALGTTREALMAEIHGRTADGKWFRGVEVFRQLYAAAGFGWLIPITRIPGIDHLLRGGYWLFARNRLRLTGRCGAQGACRLGARASVK